MRKGREQKQRILGGLTNSRKIIEEDWSHAANGGKATFRINFTEDLTAQGAIEQERVADIIRQWVFDTYRGKLGLEKHEPEKKQITFRIREPRVDEDG